MKTTLTIEIETKDSYDIYPEEGQGDDDFIGNEEELAEERRQYAIGLHQQVVRAIEDFMDDEDNIFDRLDEFWIEGWDDLKDYGIKIDIKKGEQ